MLQLRFVRKPWERHIQLDLVGFLAILGEASILANAQVTFLSPASFLPRLVPAPQALIQPKRARRLDPEEAIVVGAKSGNLRNTVSPIAHIVHLGEDLSEFEVKWVSIKSSRDPKNTKVDVNYWGPMTWLAIGGFSLFLALIALSVYFEDGMALIATMLLGLLTSLIQVGSWNSIELPAWSAKADRKLPSSDVVIRYPNGAFVIVNCEDEGIARKLYWGVEECIYKLSDFWYRAIALASTLILMIAVICLGNAHVKMQITFAASFLALNAAYWLVAALPARMHWNTKAFTVTQIASGKYERFTPALWAAIAITSTTEWVSLSGVAPRNNPWQNWLAEAEEQLRGWQPFATDGIPQTPNWDCQEALTRHLNRYEQENNNGGNTAVDTDDSLAATKAEMSSTVATASLDRQKEDSATFESLTMQDTGFIQPFRKSPTWPFKQSV